MTSFDIVSTLFPRRFKIVAAGIRLVCFSSPLTPATYVRKSADFTSPPSALLASAQVLGYLTISLICTNVSDHLQFYSDWLKEGAFMK